MVSGLLNSVNQQDATQEFLEVYKKKADKKQVSDELKAKFIQDNTQQLGNWEEERKADQSQVSTVMPEFTQMISQISQDSAKMEFFKNIDEALNTYNEVL